MPSRAVAKPEPFRCEQIMVEPCSNHPSSPFRRSVAPERSSDLVAANERKIKEPQPDTSDQYGRHRDQGHDIAVKEARS